MLNTEYNEIFYNILKTIHYFLKSNTLNVSMFVFAFPVKLLDRNISKAIHKCLE